MADSYFEPMRATAVWQADEVVVHLSGEFDLSNSGHLDEYLGLVQDQGASRLVIDLTGVEFIDSSGLRPMVSAARRARSGGGIVTVVALPPSARTILDYLPDATLLHVAEVRDAAASG